MNTLCGQVLLINFLQFDRTRCVSGLDGFSLSISLSPKIGGGLSVTLMLGELERSACLERSRYKEVSVNKCASERLDGRQAGRQAGRAASCM